MKYLKPKKFIDASVFMGMHSDDAEIRTSSIAFMNEFFNHTVYMNFEQVAICDDYIWTLPRETQDSYYPFMDCLHSQMNIQRTPYTKDDIYLMKHHKSLNNSQLTTTQSLLISQVINNDGVLYTHDPEIKALKWLKNNIGKIKDFSINDEEKDVFNKDIWNLYKKSSTLKVNKEFFNSYEY